MSFLSGLAAVGGDLLGTAVSGLYGRSSARYQMGFQKHMANTAYQRAAADLEKAGLNRILALGSPAATPPGAGYSVQSPMLGSSYQQGSSAKSLRDVNAETVKLLKEQQVKTAAETAVANSQVANVQADTALKTGTTANLPLTGEEIRARTRTYSPNIKLTEEQTKTAAALARFHGAQADTEEWKAKKYTALNPFLDLIIENILNPLANSARSAAKEESSFRKIFKQGGLHELKKQLGIP